MGLWHVASGAIFSIGWMIFFDGLTIAKQNDMSYKFEDWLPGLLCLISMFMFMFVDPHQVKGGGDDDMFGGGGGYDQGGETKSKVIFFIASFVGLGAISIAVWQLSSVYKGSDSWPGIALMLQCVGILCSIGFLFVARGQKKEDTLM